jgi:hypothetical protein
MLKLRLQITMGETTYFAFVIGIVEMCGSLANHWGNGIMLPRAISKRLPGSAAQFSHDLASLYKKRLRIAPADRQPRTPML